MGDNHQIRLWQSAADYLTLDYASLQVSYSPQGERITDRLGLVHRIAPAVRRYPTGLLLVLIPEELTRLNAAAAPERRTVLAWLEHFYRSQAELVVYADGGTLDETGAPFVRRLAFRCLIESLPAGWFGSLGRLGGPSDPVEISLLVTEDGIFTDFSSLAAYSPYSPARPEG